MARQQIGLTQDFREDASRNGSMWNLRNSLGLACKIGITAVVLLAFAWQLDVRSVARTLSTISPFAVLAAILVTFAQTCGAAERLVLVVARFHAHFRFRESLRITLEGMFFSH